MKRPGLTLAEFVVTLVVIGIVVTVIGAAYLSVTRIFQQESARSGITLGTGRVLGPLDELLRQGGTIVAQYPISGSPTVTTGTGALVFSIPSLIGGDLSPTELDYVTLERDTAITSNPRLIMTVYPNQTLPSERTSQTVVIATNVSDIYFRYSMIDPTASPDVTTTVRLTRTQSGRTLSETIILHSTLRNKL